MVPASFEDVQEPDEIAVDVRVRIGERVANAGLRGEMDDAIEAFFAEQPFQAFAITEFLAHQAKARMWRKTRKPRLLQRRIVVVIDVVQADDFVAAREQSLAGVISDEPGSAGDQNL